MPSTLSGPVPIRVVDTNRNPGRDDLEKLPAGYSGGIWTDRIDRIAPALGLEGGARSTGTQ